MRYTVFATTISALVTALAAGVTPAAGQSINASIEYLEVKPDGSVTLYPWFATRTGARFTLLPLFGGTGFTISAAAVKKQPGHCYAENVHQVTVRAATLRKRLGPVQRDRRGNRIWQDAILIAPAVPRARLMSPAQVKATDLPPGQVKINVTHVVDVNGDGAPDLMVIKTCSGYDAKKKVSQKTLDRENHRQCIHKGPAFRYLWLRQDGKWKTVWYQDLC